MDKVKKYQFPIAILLPLFIAMVAVQLYVPAKMIFGNEKILMNGNTYKFQTAPVDPNDPFRGKYVWLSYKENRIAVDTNELWTPHQTAYASLKVGEDGFAKIKDISATKPNQALDYIETTVISVYKKDGQNQVRLQFPFTRLYMEESKAYEAEQLYRKMRRDTNRQTYALVKVKDGEAILEDVYVDEKSLKDLVKEQRLQK